MFGGASSLAQQSCIADTLPVALRGRRFEGALTSNGAFFANSDGTPAFVCAPRALRTNASVAFGQRDLAFAYRSAAPQLGLADREPRYVAWTRCIESWFANAQSAYDEPFESWQRVMLDADEWNEPVFLSTCDAQCGADLYQQGCTMARLSAPSSADFDGRYRLFVARWFAPDCYGVSWQFASDLLDANVERWLQCDDDATGAVVPTVSAVGVLTCVDCPSCFDGLPSEFEVRAAPRRAAPFISPIVSQTGVDCGGRCLKPCPPSTVSTSILATQFRE